MLAGMVVLVVSVFVAFLYIESPQELFALVQRIFFYIAPPFAVVFLLGLLWRRANRYGGRRHDCQRLCILIAVAEGNSFLAADMPAAWERIMAHALQAAYQHGAR